MGGSGGTDVCPPRGRGRVCCAGPRCNVDASPEARTFGDHGARVTLAHMAQAWLRVADNCQDAKKVPPAMQQQQQIQPKDDSKKD